jgi:hypothetical protein
VGEESEELRADIEQRRESMSETIDAIGDRVVPGRIIERRRAAARDWASGMRQRIMGPAHAAQERTGSVTTRMGEGMSHAKEQIGDAPAQVQRATAGSPLIAGAVAFGIGALVAAVLPATESERRALETVQPQVDAATNAVKDVGQQAIATAKSAAQDAAQDVKASATDHAHEVADQAKEAGKQVKETATS